MKIPKTTAAIVALVTLATLTVSAAAQESVRAGVSQDRLRLTYGSGDSLFVQLIPDGRQPMPFERDASGAWVFRGDPTPLVGKSYTVRLENSGRGRIKVVVGVDGVNAYFRKPVVGAADGDVGSILGPGQTRVLTGFQFDEQTAQRFVFSPPEFSEGGQVRGARVGEIDIQLYEEQRNDAAAMRDRPSASARPEIGTTAGEDVDSEVRRVSFHASTREPIATLLLAYGRQDPRPRPLPGDTRSQGPLGVSVEQRPEGVRIVRVDPGGIGDDMGLREGDVITKVDTYLRPTVAVLQRTVRGKARGNYLFLEVHRGRHLVNFKTQM